VFDALSLPDEVVVRRETMTAAQGGGGQLAQFGTTASVAEAAALLTTELGPPTSTADDHVAWVTRTDERGWRRVSSVDVVPADRPPATVFVDPARIPAGVVTIVQCSNGAIPVPAGPGTAAARGATASPARGRWWRRARRRS
jgi:hypothetical protein